ncbi:8952_t:CDS:1, partial [Entrophospora sp. SA101]
VIEQTLNFVRTNGNKVTPRKYKDFVNKVLFPSIETTQSIKN